MGNGLDYSGQVNANTSQAEGLFDSVTGVTSENDGGTADRYSLQINTNFFTTATCNSAANPATCQGWEQFVFSSSGYAFIQYWLVNYNTTCPADWNTYMSNDCWINAANSVLTPVQTIAGLGQIKLDGAIAGVNGNTDDIAGRQPFPRSDERLAPF